MDSEHALREQIKNFRGFQFLPYIFLVLSCLITLYGWKYFQKDVERRAYLKFESIVQEIKASLRERMELYLDGLLGLGGFLSSQEKIDSGAWHAYLKTVDYTRRYPGIKILRFTERKPEGDSGSASFVVSQAASLDGDEEMLGKEPPFDSEMLAAFIRAGDEGHAVATSGISYAESAKQGGAFVFVLPVYRTGLPLNTPEDLSLYIPL